ncbi:MAG: triphosphoribosyl-dephospho-CoA synthetase [Planctomycetota bacterium]|nr:MAG: triphosphoribosyl-dephospho-CoA synthetase [Planctomycetota bacterium]
MVDSSEKVALCVQLACIWEATARKPGNVHRHCDFEDATYLDFLLSAAAIAPVLADASRRPMGVGETILQAVQATRAVVGTNTNLGIILLLAPLVHAGSDLETGVGTVLAATTVADARAAYQAIRTALPGGMGRVPEQDLAGEPTQSLVEVMRLAAGRDLIALQYANGYREIFAEGVPALTRGLEATGELEAAIILCYLRLLAAHPDTLIARKRGLAEAQEASRRARHVLQAGWPGSQVGGASLAELDRWLRAEGHSRNPGTTADLVTACLFILLRQGTIRLPSQYPWQAGLHHG